MRIISGNYSRRRLKSLAGANTRPTTGKVKGSIFNMIGPYFDGETVSDLFAGSGGLAIEAVSRDCSHAVRIDKNYQASEVIKENIETTKEPEKLTTIKLDADRIIGRLVTEKQQFDRLFPDLSRAKQKIIDQTHGMEELGPFSKTVVTVCETDKTVELPEPVVGFHQVRKQIYNIIAVTIYKKEEEQ